VKAYFVIVRLPKWNVGNVGRHFKHCCSGQFLIYTKVRTHVPPRQNLLKVDDEISRPNTSLQSTIQLPGGGSSSRGNNCPEDTPPSESIVTPRPVLSSRVRWLLQPTPLISVYMYGVRTPPDDPTFQTLQRPLLQPGLLQKVAEIAPAIKSRIKPL